MSAALVAFVQGVQRRRWVWLLLLILGAGGVTLVLRSTDRRAVPEPPAPPPIIEPVPEPPSLVVVEPAPEVSPTGAAIEWNTGYAMFVQIVDGRVYWTGDGLWSAPLDDSEPPRQIVGGYVLTFQVQGDVVTYTSSEHILRKRLDSLAPPEVLVTEDEHAIELAVDGDDLYYTVHRSKEVLRAPWLGGRQARFARGGASFTLGIDEDYLYVAEYRHGQVVKIRKRDGQRTVLARGMKRPVGLALDRDAVYFPCEGDGTLRRVAKTGGAVTILAADQFNHDLLASDGRHVYWGDWKRQNLMRAPVDGHGPAEVVAAGLRNIVGVAVDDRHVAITTEGRVLVFAK